MTKNQEKFTMIGNLFNDGVTRAVEVENIDLWPSKEARDGLMKSVVALIDLGFEGVRLEHFKVNNLGTESATLINLWYAIETPEGQIVQCLEALASLGEVVDLDMVLSDIESLYEERNLKLPYNKRKV